MSRLELGKPVRGSDGKIAGDLSDVVIDPVAKRVTHLVVKPHHGGHSRLVPVDLAIPGVDPRPSRNPPPLHRARE